jgi:hypothetical protein
LRQETIREKELIEILGQKDIELYQLRKMVEQFTEEFKK